MNPHSPKSIPFFSILFIVLATFLGNFFWPAPVRAATVTVTDCSAPSGAAGRLVETIVAAAAGDTVNFSCSGTITLSTTITLDKNLTIDGSGQTVTISGGSAVRVLIVNPGMTVTLNHLTISGGTVTGSGAGINSQGTLTISNSTISNNTATASGGGIVNSGALTILNSTISNNTATTGGGGIVNSGPLTILNSTLSGNRATAGSGGGIYNTNVTGILVVSDSTISGNSATTAGGGIYNNTSATTSVTQSTVSSNGAPSGGGIMNASGTPTLTIADSTFSGNSGTNGGAIQNRSTISVTNSTFSGNTATNRGGAMISLGGVSTIINSTLSGNGATNGGGGFYGSGTLNFSNTIIANSTSGVECFSTTIGTNLNNLVEDGSCSAGLGGDPNLGTLTNNGGPTQTFAPLSGSLAIDAGDDTVCAAAPVNGLDQRGASRWQGTHCDIGAYELDITSPWVNSFAAPATTFSLDIPITDFTANDDFSVAGYLITQSATPPLASDSGWSGTVPAIYHVATTGTYDLYPWVKDSDGNVSSLYGFISVTVLSCTSSSITVTNASDSGAGSLRQALADICPDGAITFNSGLSGATILLAAELTIDRNLTINGSALASPVSISGNNAVRVFFINSGVTATLDSLKIINGYNDNFISSGGGIYLLNGSLTLKNSTLSGNTADNGGGLYNQGGNVTVENSTLSGNSALSSGGGGILNYGGTLTVQNSTLTGNMAASGTGGAIFNDNSSTLTIVNSTLSGNAAINGGAIANQDSNAAMIRNSTLSGNTATNVGGGIFNNSLYAPSWWTTFGFVNTIVANSTNGADCYNTGMIVTNTNNLVEDGSCSAGLSGDPNLGVLADNGGPTQTFALLVGSSAIDAGNAAACPSADQRGATRPTDGDANGTAICDIGAFELGGLQCGIQSAAEPADYTYLSNVNLRVTDDGTDLNCLRVTDIPYNHPNATTSLKTSKYWQIVALQADQSTAATTDFSVNLTLPFATADATDKLCRYTGSGWDCAADGYVANTSVTRNNISQFSDWTVGDNSGPTAVRLSRLTATSGTAGFPGLWLALAGILVLGGLMIYLRLHKIDEK